MATEFEHLTWRQKYFSSDYLHLLKTLLPRGPIWGWDKLVFIQFIQDVIVSHMIWQDAVSAPDEIQDSVTGTGEASGSLFARILSCFADELSRLERDAYRLMRESVPGLSVELLPDYERVLGLPEKCIVGPLTLEDRQRAAHAKMFDTFKVTTFQYFIDYAATLGFVIEIQEVPFFAEPRIMGVARMGKERMAGRGSLSVLLITVISGDGNLDQMKCIFEDIKLAHSIIVWIGPEYIGFTHVNSTDLSMDITIEADKAIFINWGDGDDVETFVGTGTSENISHTYADVDAYEVKIYEGENSIETFSAPAEKIYGPISEFAELQILNQLDFNSGFITYNEPVSWIAFNGAFFDCTSCNWSTADVDNCLIDLDNAGVINSTINIAGTNAARSSASDTAVTNLIARGCTINVN